MKLKPKITQYLLLISLFISFLFNLELHAQKKQIDWSQYYAIEENISPDPESPEWVGYFYFQDAAYPDVETMLPHYYEILEGNEYDPGSIRIHSILFDTLNLTEYQHLKGIEHLDTAISLTSKVIYLQREPNLQFSFLPILKKGDKLLLVKSFDLSYKKTERQFSVNTKATNEISETNSVLNSGNWYKMKVKETGIYKITYEELADLGITNPGNVRIYGNVGGQLAFNTSGERITGLQENPLFMHKGSDGAFGGGDYILFYGQGPDRWKYSDFDDMLIHYNHNYSDFVNYFLTSDLGPGKRINNADEPDKNPEITFLDYTYCDYYEKDERNLAESGRQWFEPMISSQMNISFNIPDLLTSRNAKLKVRMAGRSKGSSSFYVYHGNTRIGEAGISSVNLNSHEGYYARAAAVVETITPTSDEIEIKVRYNRQTSEDKGYLDYVMLNGYRQLKLSAEPLIFRQTSQEQRVARFEIMGGSDQTLVWDVTAPHSIKQMNSSFSNNRVNFKVSMNGLKEFVAFDIGQSFLKPEFEDEQVPNQNLMGMEPVNYIIVTHPDFLEHAKELADIHREKSQMTVAVVTPQQIYNEFSSGAPDVTAIRDFFKWIYDKDNPENPVFKYALLFGDGTYENKNPESGSSYILTYQSGESLHQTKSFVADDFFTFLDPNEGDNGGTMDIGIGRFPVQTTDQATAVLNKIKQYLDPQTMGPWRNRLYFVGDDEDNNIHMDQADRLTRKLDINHPEFQINKVYLDAYRQQVSANGTTYPEVEKNIFDALENGMLVFNYTGHGSENGLAHERIILKGDILNWKNAPYFPLFITATCEFSRFDNPAKTTAGEYVLLNPEGGGIALLTTTRLVYSGDNFTLNNSFYDYAFKLDSQGNKYRFGDVLRLSKNAISGTNKRNFTLLGDPALEISYPRYRVFTDSINEISVSQKADTISAFSEVTVSGYVGSFDGTPMNEFSGSIYPVIMDKEQEITTLNNDDDGVYTFKVRNNTIYKGKASVNNGRFDFTFIVPRDIGYSIGQGKILYYAENQDIDAHGYNTALYIGGAPENMIGDNIGPDINLYLNDSNFVNGGISGTNPDLYAVVLDESGINATGAGIGHDIVAYLNGNTKEVFVLNEYYETLQDNYKAGTIKYPLQNLEPGWHTLTLKVWDIVNNSSEKTIDFQVLAEAGPVLENVYNYPNPFSNTTWFNVEHNLAGKEIQVTIDIFDLSGRIVRKIESNLFSGGYRLAPLQWDGTNEQGGRLGSGIYPYRVTMETEDGTSVQKFSKLILR